jgi:hypothetical protein
LSPICRAEYLEQGGEQDDPGIEAAVCGIELLDQVFKQHGIVGNLIAEDFANSELKNHSVQDIEWIYDAG